MSELRQDGATGQWVLIAPQRKTRPDAFQGRSSPGSLPSFDPTCPFCPGNEGLLPGVIEEVPGNDPPGWLVRVVPNRFPAVAADAAADTETDRGGYGHHEVIIETSRHDARLSDLSAAEIEAVIRTYRSRYRQLAAETDIASVILFRNQGPGSGASLMHPHAQIIATAFVPPRTQRIWSWAAARYRQTGRCVACTEIEAELAAKTRVVEATEHFLVVVPYAATSPFELHIIPRRHRNAFGDLGDAEAVELGALLQGTIWRLEMVCGDPPYNFVVEGGTARDDDRPDLHWRLRIVPDLIRPGGFELGGGLPINPSSPEGDAALLRGARRPMPS